MQGIAGEIKIVLAVTLLLILITSFVIFFLFLYQKRYYQHKKEKEELKNQFSQTLLQSQIEIQEQTQQHISRELHDNLGQMASLIKINLHTISVDDREKALRKIEDTRELTKQLITDIKLISVKLGSDRIEKTGLINALETEVERINRTEQFNASFINCTKNLVPDKDRSVILFRMAQEVLNNMVKHSGAKHISVDVSETETLFILAFSDDGKGFDPEQHKNSGSGLMNLEKRATLINAKLSMQSSPGNGTRVSIEMPV
jgi:signal transduction histidine kinase